MADVLDGIGLDAILYGRIINENIMNIKKDIKRHIRSKKDIIKLSEGTRDVVITHTPNEKLKYIVIYPSKFNISYFFYENSHFERNF